MSGNPFRRHAQHSQQPYATPQLGLEASNAQAENVPQIDTERRRSSVVKRVRIATPPPLSPDSPYEENPIIRRVSNESHEGSPPPSPQLSNDSSNDSDADDADELFNSRDDPYTSDEVMENTRRNSETNMVPRGSAGGVVNPFQRTLATMEPKDNSAAELDTADVAAKNLGAGVAASEPNKGQMDVDAFKRMLMTGDPSSTEASNSPAPSSTAATSSGYMTGDSYDTSSLSQYSLSEASQRTPALEKKSKPSPPKHRHGKSVDKQRTPQTVSFDDFSPTEAPQVPPRPRNKVLPQVPQRRNTSDDLSPSSRPILPSKMPSESLQSPEADPLAEHPELPSKSQTPQRNPPPPPPLARRSSQAQTKQLSLTHEDSNSGFSSPRPQPSASSPAGASKPAKVPPPPPTRRPGSKQVSSSDPPVSESIHSAIVDEPTNMATSRSSSIASRNRISMPPPPPPRRRGSSKSSVEPPSRAILGSLSPTGSRRTSQDSVIRTSEQHLGKAVESLDYRPEAESGDTNVNVLADMDRLQAEVEALRAKYRKSG